MKITRQNKPDKKKRLNLIGIGRFFKMLHGDDRLYQLIGTPLEHPDGNFGELFIRCCIFPDGSTTNLTVDALVFPATVTEIKYEV